MCPLLAHRPNLQFDHATCEQRDIEIDTLSTLGLAGPAHRQASPPTWLVLADSGQEDLGNRLDPPQA
jgi:hypothetical protein